MQSRVSPMIRHFIPCGKWAFLSAAIAMSSVGAIRASDFTAAADGNWTSSGTWTKSNSTNTHTYPQADDNIIGNVGNASITLDTGSFDVNNVTIGGSNVLFRPTNTTASTVNLNVGGDFTKGAAGGTFSLRNNSNALLNVSISGSLDVDGGVLQFGSASGGQNLNSLTVSGETTVKSGALLNVRTTTAASFAEMTVEGTMNIANFGGAGANVSSLSGTSVTAVIQANHATNTSGTLTINGNAVTPATYAGILRNASPSSTGGVLSLSKSGTGTQIFSGVTNTYTGTTQVSGGTLLVNGNHTGGTNYTVTGNGTTSATLGGGGTIVLAADQSVTISSTNALNKGILAPGTSSASTATLTLGSAGVATDLVFGANSRLSINVGASTASSRVALFGDLDLSGSTDELFLNSLSGAFDGTNYVIATYTGSLIGTFDTITGLDGGYVIDYGSGTNSAITLQAIPEPGSVTLLLIAGGLLWTVGLRRRRLMVA